MFFDDGDAECYLALLHFYARSRDITIWAYCLMPNHVHLVMCPSTSDGMHRALRSVHSQYAQRINRMREITGHLWQGRYFSSPLDSAYFLNAVRYVELNPVRAGLAAKAEDYAWSSARFHCGLAHSALVEQTSMSPVLAGISEWSAWLAKGLSSECTNTLRQHGQLNLPCGSSDYVSSLERSSGRDLKYRPRGRPAMRGEDEY